jgi:iron complex outermembrane receptor protein
MVAAGESPSEDPSESEPESDDETPRSPEPVLTERVTVTTTRLPDRPEPVEEVPAHVSVIGRDQIERSAVPTLQDILGMVSSAVLYDQVGNDIQKTFDLRGFNSGTGTKVYLDAVPLNDPRNNRVPLYLVPLTAVDRVEVVRGSAAQTTGSGSEAGVINIHTRVGEGFHGALSLAAGTFDASEFAGEISGTSGPFDFAVSGSRGDTDGFRENAGGELRRLGGNLGFDLGSDRRLQVTVMSARSDLGNPGALTLDELADDPAAAPFNQPDFSNEQFDQASVLYRGALTGPFSVSANLYYRNPRAQILTTGRAAPSFGGFVLDIDGSVVGSTIQVGHEHRTNHLAMGLELLEGSTDSLGTLTPPDDPGNIDALAPSSDNTTDHTDRAIFVQDTWRPLAKWAFTAGARWDRDEVKYDESLPDPANLNSRTFTGLSLRAGATWSTWQHGRLYLSYGEGFLPPTAEQLFAFPLFGSNPTLEPEESRAYEFGYFGHWRESLELDATVFRVNTENEIIFDPDSPLGLFGANVNARETRRDGLEISFRGRVVGNLDLFSNVTLIEAEFLNGPNRGNTVPLVPSERFALGFALKLPAGFELMTDGLYVSQQVLENDEANDQPELPAYSLVNARISWHWSGLSRSTSEGKGPVLFVEARNLLDETYATRGIYAFDFSSFQDEIFVTPAPGRRYLAGAAWKF